MRKIIGVLALSATLYAFSDAASSANAQVKVTIDSGVLAGRSDGAVAVYKGIPYAAPPIGILRWEPPVLPARWSGERDASQYGPICPQSVRDNPSVANSPQSEDCLFLNVWTPVGTKNAPVMLWVHGGWSRLGTGASPVFDGTSFAHDGIVLVTINYRLGALGYFAHPALTRAAKPDEPLGNYGLMDQIAALQWVQRNIAKFGGDPKNVTLFGESAGGSATLVLLSMPSAKGLFAKAIVESGGGWNQGVSLSQAEAEGATLATMAGLPGASATLEQLRAVPAATTASVPFTVSFGPFVDGRLVKKTPSQAFADGSATDMPLIIGSNSYEASLMKPDSISPASVLARLPAADRPLYAADGDTDEAVAQAVFTDSAMGAPAHWIAGQAAGGAPSFLYHFSYVPTAMRGKVPGAAHGSEIAFVFATGSAVAAYLGIPVSDQDRAMSHLMHSCWAGFAKTGTPTCDGQSWPAYTPQTDQLMEFGSKPGVVANFRAAQYKATEAVILRWLNLPH